jgi:uncharacterized protein VirK/YbjX
MRLRFLAAAAKRRRRIAAILTSPGALGRAVGERPELLGTLIWPYQCAAWDADERLDRLTAHYAEIDRLGVPFAFGTDEKLVLATLEDMYPGLRIVLDQPPWFMREGGLTLNLFVGTFRAFSLAFSLCRDGRGGLEVVIGSIQGRNAAAALDLYRDLTRALHGLRPRDFLIEVMRMLCRDMGATRILAVADAVRHHRHDYFGKSEFQQNYDEIWNDRGGVPVDDRFFSLPVAPERRDMETIKPNKRPLYRRRHAFLDDLEARMSGDLAGLTPTQFTDE